MKKSFTATELQKNPSNVFNKVQTGDHVLIESKSRPNMVMILECDLLAMKEKVAQLSDMVKKLDGDAKDQLDMLKG